MRPCAQAQAQSTAPGRAGYGLKHGLMHLFDLCGDDTPSIVSCPVQGDIDDTVGLCIDVAVSNRHYHAQVGNSRMEEVLCGTQWHPA